MKFALLRSTPRERLPTKGFSLIEALLAASIFSLLATSFVGAIIYGQEGTAIGGARARAVSIADEGLEATRNIRDSDFTNLNNGTSGLTTGGGFWSFSGSSDTTDIFTRQIVITTPSANRRQVISRVNWTQNPERSGTVELVTYQTNWRAASGGRGGGP